MGDPQYLTYPQLALAQSVFTLASPSTTADAKQSSLTSLQDAIREHKMAPLYAYLAHPQTGKINASGESGSAVMSPTLSRSNTNMSSTGPPSHALRRTSSINAPSMLGVLGGKTDTSVELPWDEALYNELKADNEKELVAIAKEEEEAAEKAGDTEVTAQQSKRAELYARIGDKDAALAEFEKLLDKTGILATKIDIVLAIIRIALFFDDKILARTNIARASTLVESGGDWDRRNRLKGVPRPASADDPSAQSGCPSAARLAQHIHERRAVPVQQSRRLRHARGRRQPAAPGFQGSRRRRTRDPRHLRRGQRYGAPAGTFWHLFSRYGRAGRGHGGSGRGSKGRDHDAEADCGESDDAGERKRVGGGPGGGGAKVRFQAAVDADQCAVQWAVCAVLPRAE